MTPRRYVFLILVIMGMGFSAPLIRTADSHPLLVVFWRIALCWPLLFTMARLRKESFDLRPMWAGAFLLLHWILWTIAVNTTTIAAAAVLVSTGALWSTVLSKPFLKEATSSRQWLGLAVALVGVVVIVSTGGGPKNHSWLGDACALASALAWVGYSFVGRSLRKSTAFWSYTTVVYGAAGIGAAILYLAWWVLPFESSPPSFVPPPSHLLALAGVALIPTLLGHGGFNYLLRFIPAAKLGTWTLGEPIIATLVAWPAFGEVPSTLFVVGAGLTLVGVAISLERESRDGRMTTTVDNGRPQNPAETVT